MAFDRYQSSTKPESFFKSGMTSILYLKIQKELCLLERDDATYSRSHGAGLDNFRRMEIDRQSRPIHLTRF
jgi:hypothetical protein